MYCDAICLREVTLPLLRPFESSASRTVRRRFVLVEAMAGGLSGWGECVAQEAPYYTEETVETAWHILRDFLAPAVLNAAEVDPRSLPARFRLVKGHPMAKTALETALWDLTARAEGESLAGRWGAGRPTVPSGVSVGMAPGLDALFREIDGYLEQGYRRVKVKVGPGRDVAVVRALRERYGAIPLMVDANGAYGSEDLPVLLEMDGYDLMMIEEPLRGGDLLAYPSLQERLKTPICLDESLRGAADVRRAAELGACRVVNLKPGRVGGPSEALEVEGVCRERGLDLWVGGMLESGVGRALNLILAALPGVTLPGDTSASDRYYARDLVTEPARLQPDGTVPVPQGPGLGIEVDREYLDRVSGRVEWIRPTGRREP
ncbi:o-succinylbenzoate synthase [Limnochorda pilosa]|uniref:o-succinylbenzoate synthase n=1 Tax=Limnochorda pilosa TaxID=1555112 RepID=A0A0K2SIG9_LIMPI|nr:o-succinylbenzoate synthase [Limnochorda pilosa]BAS26903.1 O-succinylbenzoate synthase [Limnochorda pilosa]